MSSLIRKKILSYVSARPGIGLQELLTDISGIATSDDIYSLISAGDLYVDLYGVPLAEPEKVCGIDCRDTEYAYSTISQKTSTLALSASQPQTSCASTQGVENTAASEMTKTLLGASENDLRLANARFQIIREYITGGPATSHRFGPFQKPAPLVVCVSCSRTPL
jgi:hypothetical protein